MSSRAGNKFGSRSKNSDRAIVLAFRRYKKQLVGYRSATEAIHSAKLTISEQGFLKGFRHG
jgi:hypothetical protein